jgi:hypothetical protein
MRAGLALTLLYPVPSAEAAAKAERTVLYLHGSMPLGEADWPDALMYGRYMEMNERRPSNLTPSSTALWPPAGNPDCAANPFLPVWVASISGKVVGDLRLRLHLASTGGEVEIRIWKDLFFARCDSDRGTYEYPPAIKKKVSIPSGQARVGVTLPNKALDPVETVVMQITPLDGAFGRLLYDSTDYDSALSFWCQSRHGVGCWSADILAIEKDHSYARRDNVSRLGSVMAENLALWILIVASFGVALGIALSQFEKLLLRSFRISYESVDRWVATHPWLSAALGGMGGGIGWLVLRLFTKGASLLHFGAMVVSLAAGSFLRARWLARNKPTAFPEGTKSPWYWDQTGKRSYHRAMTTKVVTVLAFGFACTATTALFSLLSDGPHGQLLLIPFVFGTLVGSLTLVSYGRPPKSGGDFAPRSTASARPAFQTRSSTLVDDSFFGRGINSMAVSIRPGPRPSRWRRE